MADPTSILVEKLFEHKNYDATVDFLQFDVFKRSNFSSIIGSAFARQQPAASINDVLSKLKMSAIAKTAFAFSVFQTTADIGIRKESKDILRGLLAQVAGIISQEISSSNSINSSGDSDKSEMGKEFQDTIHSVAHCVLTSDELSTTLEGKDFINALSKSSTFSSLTASGIGKRSVGYLEFEDEFDLENVRATVATAGRSANAGSESIADILTAKGPECSSTEDSFRAALQSIEKPLDEVQVAGLMVALTTKWARAEGAAASTSGWNDKVISAILRKDTRSIPLQWPKVARAFDMPDLSLASEEHFIRLLKNYRFLAGSAFPVSVLLNCAWSNVTAQFTLLYWATMSEDLAAFVDLSNLQSSTCPQLAEHSAAAPIAWMSPVYYSTLLSLANAGLAGPVNQSLREAAEKFPDYVLVCLAQVKPSEQQSMGLARLIRADVITSVLPKFTGLSGSSSSSVSVMKLLLISNQELLSLLLRVAFKQSKALHDVAKICNVFKGMGRAGAEVLKKVEDEGSCEEVLSYWCYRADTDPTFSLEAPVRTAVDSGSEGLRVVLEFIKMHCNGANGPIRAPLQPGKAVESLPMPSSLLTNDTLAVLLRCLQRAAAQNGISLEPGDLQLVTSLTGNQKALQIEQPQAFGVSYNEQAFSHLQRLFRGEVTVEILLETLKGFKSSSEEKDQLVLSSVIRSLLDEIKFVHKYPEAELRATAELLGALINASDLIVGKTLGLALRYILEALRKNPEQGGGHEKVFKFGQIAVQRFVSRLPDLPQLCLLLREVSHLEKLLPDIFKAAVNYSQKDGINGASTEGITRQVSDVTISPPTSATSLLGPTDSASHASVIDRMVKVNVDVAVDAVPPDALRDQISFLVNNIAKSNVEAKCVELQKLLKVEYYGWFASFLVTKRISTQPNYHAIYLSMLDILDAPLLTKGVIDSTMYQVTQLLQSPTIYTTSSTERSLLRNLGIWLGQVTLARNKPIMQRRLDIKELIFWAYETGRLIAICSFIGKIIEGCRDSVVFRPPNPWLMAVLGVLREIYEVDDLKMNIKFEVQVLCKNINIRIEEVPTCNALSQLRAPVRDGRNPDFNALKTVVASTTVSKGATSAAAAGSIPLPAGATAFMAPPEPDAVRVQPVIPNIESYIVISSKLTFFSSAPQHRILVSQALSQSIREIIASVLEKIVPISCATTKSIILKDFATEPNEQTLRDAAHFMTTALVSNLSVVTSKELLRLGMTQHLRALLQRVTNDAAAIEEIVQTCVDDNLNLGCAVIEKASIERVTREIDDCLAFAYLARKMAREKNQPFSDAVILAGDSSRLSTLPSELKCAMGGLQSRQLALYESFQRLRYQAAPKQAQTTPSAANIKPAEPIHSTPMAQQVQSESQSLNIAQALEGYRIVFERIDVCLKQVRQITQGRDMTISMLGNDHEIVTRFRDIVAITNRTQVVARVEAAMTFSEGIFKRLFDTASQLDALQLEVMVGALETLRNASGGSQHLIQEAGVWLARHGNINVDDETNRKNNFSVLVLLLRTRVLRSSDIDSFFVLKLSGYTSSLLWVEFCLTFIRRCLIDSLASAYEFPNTLQAINNVRPQNAMMVKQLQKWLSDLQALAASKNEPDTAAGPNRQMPISGTQPSGPMGQNMGSGVSVRGSGPQGGSWGPMGGPGAVPMQMNGPAGAVNMQPLPPLAIPLQIMPRDPRHAAARDQVAALLERWLRIWAGINEQLFTQYLQLMHQYGILATEEAADMFFKVATELCTEACLKTAQQGPVDASGGAQTVLSFTVIDALSKLFLLLMRIADKESGDMAVRLNLLTRLLSSIGRALLEDHETKKQNKLVFDQRPYCRLILALMSEVGTIDPVTGQEPNALFLSLLTVYGQILYELRPSRAPGFAFGWLDLLSSPNFMTQLLLLGGKKGWPILQRLLCSLLHFMQPFLKSGQLNEAVRKLYKGVLRVMVAIYQEFPEFLQDYYLVFCEVVPSNCVPLRNLACAAVPRGVSLPNPLTPNLSWDKPEMLQIPLVNVDFANSLNPAVRQVLDSYIDTRQPAELPSMLPSMLRQTEGPNSIATISAIVVYLGMRDCMNVVERRVTLVGCASFEVYRHLLRLLETEGRYHVIHAMLDSLRYPNVHTCFFSAMLLLLFFEPESGVPIQEQITRALLERLVAAQPHPWGVVYVFVELVQNPKYSLLSRGFTKSVPEVERVFQSLAASLSSSAQPM